MPICSTEKLVSAIQRRTALLALFKSLLVHFSGPSSSTLQNKQACNSISQTSLTLKYLSKLCQDGMMGSVMVKNGTNGQRNKLDYNIK